MESLFSVCCKTLKLSPRAGRRSIQPASSGLKEKSVAKMSDFTEKKLTNPIIIKRGLRIGDLDAETDVDLLKSCFIDNGELELLEDVTRPESIIVGRTGSGKSALLLTLSERAWKSKILDPNDISIRFLENSDIIQFFEKIGVNLDLFYRLLWRHVLTIEFLKLRYDLSSETESKNVVSRLMDMVARDNAKKEALSYFKEWGGKFWLETDQQIKEITEKLSQDIKAGFGAELAGVDISVEGAKKLSTERKSEIVHKANSVVSQIQIRKLADILDLLQEKVFDDRQKNYFLLIDKLDEEWADTETRYRFIRALIEEIKTFRRITNVKIVVAMRRDLLDIVFDKTRDSGFQQEKYESYILPVRWSKESLHQMVNSRINEVFKRKYTKDGVKFKDIFPSPRKGGGQESFDYLVERTLYRPRDILQFINECFVAAIDSERVSWRAISSAETNYSEKRLNSLFEEWSKVIPSLPILIEVLRGMQCSFKRSQLTEKIDSISDKLIDFPDDPCGKAVIDFCSESSKGITASDVAAEILSCFYRVGAIGVKLSKNEPFAWSDFDHSILSKSAIKRVEQIKIHKMIHKTLGVRDPEEEGVL